MKTTVNLLPWRLIEHKKRSYRECIYLSLWFMLIMLAHYGLQQADHYSQANISQQKEQLQILAAQLKKIEQDVQLSKQHLSIQQQQATQTTSLPRIAQPLFKMLSQLPFQQGELQMLSYMDNQLSLRGIAKNQTEFEALHQYLKQTKWASNIKLTQFAHQHNQLQFEFQLSLTPEIDKYENIQ